jgi:hypothetical protein
MQIAYADIDVLAATLILSPPHEEDPYGGRKPVGSAAAPQRV